MLVKVDEHVCCELVQLNLTRRVFVEELAKAPVSEVGEEQQPLFEIACEDLRGAEAYRGEPFGDGDERARILMRRRRVHQHRRALSLHDSEIAAERSVAGKRKDL